MDNGTERGQSFLDRHAERAAQRGRIALPESTQSDDQGVVDPLLYADELEALHVNQPRPSEAMLYGLAGDVGRVAAATTEANPYAVCMGFLSFLSAMAGRDIYLPVGNTRHHARLFTLHVGRSSRGRKGDALSLVHRIRHAIDKRELMQGTVGGSVLGQVHTGGLSSREGLVMFIHDGFRQGKEEIPAIADKRLWVVESEFANVLQQAKRDGNTLSSALRDAWDGVSIKPATKSSRTWTTDPHIAIAGAITPSELNELMRSRELSNGFANRFLIFWAERERLIPFPQATDDASLTRLVDRTEAVLKFMRGNYPAECDTRRMGMIDEAQAEYDKLYRGELNKGTGSTKLDGILERRPPMLLRLAMLFALTDSSLRITLPHIEAAAAWVAYYADSVRYIFKDAGEADIERLAAASEKLFEYLSRKDVATRKEITNECFQRRVPEGGLDAVIAELLNATPPKIESVQLPRRDGLVGKGRTIYRVFTQQSAADIADLADIGMNTGFARSLPVADIGGLRADSAINGHPMSAKSAPKSAAPNQSESRMDSLSPLSPQSPHGANENNPGSVVEVEI